MAIYTSSTGAESPSCSSRAPTALVKHREWERVVEEFDAIARPANAIRTDARACTSATRSISSCCSPEGLGDVNDVLRGSAKRPLRIAGPGEHERHGDSTHELFRQDADLMAHFNKGLPTASGITSRISRISATRPWRDPPQNSLNADSSDRDRGPGGASLRRGCRWLGARGQAQKAPRCFRVLMPSPAKPPISRCSPRGLPYLRTRGSERAVDRIERDAQGAQAERRSGTVDWARAPRRTATGAIVVSVQGARSS